MTLQITPLPVGGAMSRLEAGGCGNWLHICFSFCQHGPRDNSSPWEQQLAPVRATDSTLQSLYTRSISFSSTASCPVCPPWRSGTPICKNYHPSIYVFIILTSSICSPSPKGIAASYNLLPL